MTSSSITSNRSSRCSPSLDQMTPRLDNQPLALELLNPPIEMPLYLDDSTVHAAGTTV
jgi:hypothetical protein